MDAPDLFKTAPREVTRYFEAKDTKPSFDWRDIAPEEHAFAFTVAKSTGYDILDDMKAAIGTAIEKRQPFEEFQKNIIWTLHEKGWWGKSLEIDPQTGEEKLVQLGSTRRLRTIYWANTATAHAAGEWERTERNKAFLPFLVYVLSTAERKRPEHERWVGIVAPVDDPIWKRLYPPNGWGCQCRIRQITRREALSLGWRDGEPAFVIKERPWRNKRTGETIMLPEGVDPGWDTNPGQLRSQNTSRFLHEKIEAMAPARQRIAIDDIVQSPVLKAMAEGHMPKAYLPVAQLPARLVEDAGASAAVVRLSSDSVGHILVEHAERGLAIDDFRSAISVMTAPAAIIRAGSAAALLGVAAGQWWRAVVKSADGGREWWLQSFHRKSAAEALKVIDRAKRSGKIVE
ncbi:phage minor head protein [Shinella kummerowiae]|uniref:phage head morphogenesis protein n=1 Tax=Shinella kummerowiae TaxID=417745 RepID=UPI0021B61C4A|nr:phage minor head protein [Shinella kummerowiae]MCT7668174.1 phage minor head protein [Shinella kummerowiae]